MAEKARKIPLIFYRGTCQGVRGLDEAERQTIGKDLLRAQWRWP